MRGGTFHFRTPQEMWGGGPHFFRGESGPMPHAVSPSPGTPRSAPRRTGATVQRRWDSLHYGGAPRPPACTPRPREARGPGMRSATPRTSSAPQEMWGGGPHFLAAGPARRHTPARHRRAARDRRARRPCCRPRAAPDTQAPTPAGATHEVIDAINRVRTDARPSVRTTAPPGSERRSTRSTTRSPKRISPADRLPLPGAARPHAPDRHAGIRRRPDGATEDGVNKETTDRLAASIESLEPSEPVH